MDLIRGMLFLSRAEFGAAGQALVGTKCVWEGNYSPGINIGEHLGTGAVGQGAQQELAVKYSFPGHSQGTGGSAKAQNSAKRSFPVGWEQGKSSVAPAALLSPSRANKVSGYQHIYLFPAPFGDF